MNIILLNQELNQKQTKKTKFGNEPSSALVMPTDFSPEDELENMPRVMVIDAQPSSSNSTTSSSSNSSSRESAVIIPVDISIERHQVPIIVADQNDLNQEEKESRNYSESLGLWSALFVRDKDQEHVLSAAH
ncbi:MAG: hypothetical protein CL609_14635 [Anaerolineaceae bacterium]|nr:hypothetical protein [Anaerolineaceae bacterium]